MAFAEVGSGSQRATSGSNSGANSDALAFPGNVTAGNLLVVAGAIWGATTPTAPTVTDSQSNSYTVILATTSPSGTTWRTFIAYAVAGSSAACTITVNPNLASNDFSFSIDEFSGQHATPADVDGGTTVQEGGTTMSDAITTGVDNALIIAVTSYEGSTTTITVTAPATEIAQNPSNSGNQAHAASFRIATAAGAYTMAWTLGTDLPHASQTYSFKPSTGGGATVTRQMLQFHG